MGTSSRRFRNTSYVDSFFFFFIFFFFHLRLFIPSSNGFSCSNPFLHSPYRSCPCWAKESESTSKNGSGAYGCRNRCASGYKYRRTLHVRSKIFLYHRRVHQNELRRVLPHLQRVLQILQRDEILEH